MISLCKLVSIKIFILLIEGSVRLKLGTVFICNLKSFCKASLSQKNYQNYKNQWYIKSGSVKLMS